MLADEPARRAHHTSRLAALDSFTSARKPSLYPLHSSFYTLPLWLSRSSAGCFRSYSPPPGPRISCPGLKSPSLARRVVPPTTPKRCLVLRLRRCAHLPRRPPPTTRLHPSHLMRLLSRKALAAPSAPPLHANPRIHPPSRLSQPPPLASTTPISARRARSLGAAAASAA